MEDKKRSEFNLAVGDKAYIRLHEGYHLPGIPKPKIGQQRVGPFEVEAIIGTNAYRLKLPPHWRIWPVISSIYLDRAPDNPDPFGRDRDIPQPVIEEGAAPSEDIWEVAAIIQKRKFRRKTQYLIRWLGFGPEHDVWKDEDELFGCADLIRSYEHAIGNMEWMEPAN